MKDRETIGGVLLFLLGGVTAALSLQLPLGTIRVPGTGLFPLCLGTLLMALSALFLAGRIHAFRENGQGRKAPCGGETDAGQMMRFLGAAALSLLALPFLGYPLTTFLLLLFLLRTLGVPQGGVLVSLSAGAAAAAYVLFVQWLKIPLPKGWIGL